MSRLIHCVCATQLAFFASVGCEEEITLPPEEEEVVTKPLAERDRRYSANIQADRQIIVANLALVLQPDPLDPKSMALTLTTTRPGLDESRMVLGTFVPAGQTADLTITDLHFSSFPLFEPRGNGVFTARAAYQPKFATLGFDAIDETEAHGTFSGEFYRFSMERPTLRPEVVTIEARFVAAVIHK